MRSSGRSRTPTTIRFAASKTGRPIGMSGYGCINGGATIWMRCAVMTKRRSLPCWRTDRGRERQDDGDIIRSAEPRTVWGGGARCCALEHRQILGIAGNRAADLRNGTFRLARPEPAFRAGQYLVRLFQELSVLIGDDRSVMAWLQTENMDLGGRPIDLVRTERGLRELLSYVETRSASS
jgi:hypothetical protein